MTLPLTPPMPMSTPLRRRHFTALAGLGSLGALGTLSACASLNTTPLAERPALALHALNRLGYGPRPGELERLAPDFDWTAHLEAQLQPASLPLPDTLQTRLDALKARSQPLGERVVAYREAERRANADKDENARREQIQQAQQDNAEARLARALLSPRQLEERLVEFWFNHFNVFFAKGICRVMTGPFEEDAIRPHVLGRFRDLLGAATQHPAMLFYLDNWLSVREGFNPRGAGGGAARGLNENHARELMELHTLGVHGGYQQADVTALARVLTGWTMDPRRSDAFLFDARRHDPGEKTWLGQRVPGRGQAQGEWVLDQLARHPATAQRVASKLAQHFVADTPDPALVQATAQAFLASDGDLRVTTRTLLLHPLARSPAVQQAQFKTPYRYVLSLLRATDATPAPGQWQPVLQALRSLGQPLQGCVTPDGYKCTRDAWLDPEALARRAELATRTAERVRARPDALLATLGSGIGPRTRERVAQEPEGLRAALLLASPDFQNT